MVAPRKEEGMQHSLTRRRFVERAGAVAVAAGAAGALGIEPATGAPGARLDRVRWISPRGTLEVMDDYNLWVPIKMGYFKRLGIDVQMIAGPLSDALASAKFVGQNKADLGYPSPGVLTAAIDAGVPVIGVWEMIAGQVFNFSVRPDSSIRSVKDLAGKRISLGNNGWRVIVDPILTEVGVKPSSVKYVTAGAQWAQAVSQGKADAALSWEGLRAQWKGQGLNLRHLPARRSRRCPRTCTTRARRTSTTRSART